MDHEEPVSQVFTGDFQGYKELAAQFFRKLKAAQKLTAEQIEAGLHALNLGYIYMKGNENEIYQAGIVLTLAHQHADRYRR